jgi:F-type H+-transporting ATPase subunit b
MELNWSTFALEILNFLVLVWILKRFLYKPVLNVIAQRRALIEQARSESERLKSEAQSLRERYESRLADWEREKEKARTELLDEIGGERVRLQDGLRASLEQEREKARALQERRISDLARQAEETAIALGGQFVARLLSRLVAPDLETRLVGLALEDLRGLPEEQRQAIRDACSKVEETIRVTSAFPLDQARRGALAAGLQQLVGRAVCIEWLEDSTLLAGVRISIGPWVLRANLLDELQFFVESAHRADH